MRTLADKSTGEDKRFVVEKVEELRKATVGLRKQARGEDFQRVAELEESLKKLEEEMLPWSIEEQDRQEEREHAAMRNVATSARMAAKMTAVTSGEPEIKARTRPAGKAKERVTEERVNMKAKLEGKECSRSENLVMDEIQENHREDVTR